MTNTTSASWSDLSGQIDQLAVEFHGQRCAGEARADRFRHRRARHRPVEATPDLSGRVMAGMGVSAPSTAETPVYGVGATARKSHDLWVNAQCRRLHGAHRVAAQHRGPRPASREPVAPRAAVPAPSRWQRPTPASPGGVRQPVTPCSTVSIGAPRSTRPRAGPWPVPRSPRGRTLPAASRHGRPRRPAATPLAYHGAHPPNAAGRQRPT